jgi:glyoxylase-like metal-dependent hydrolase (beta-lactamase superfamily II)
MKIAENVYVVPNVIANSYILVDADGLTVIDTGIPGSHKKILAYITGPLGKSARDVKRILLTHSDLDHVGGLAALHKATGARTYASQIEAQAIAAGKSSREVKPSGFSMRRVIVALMGPFMKVVPFQVDEIVEDGQTLLVLGGLRVVGTPGHTPGHLSFFAPSSGVLFCGDSIVSEKGLLQSSRPSFTWDNAIAAESTRKQAALGARIVASGHGPVVDDAVFPQV